MLIASAACGLSVLVWSRSARADPPTAPADAATIAPSGSFFSSLKQALKQDLNYEVVRGHFDVGAAPDSHRFYCLVDIRTGKNEEYGVSGDTFVRPDGMTGIKAGAVSPDSCAKVEEQGRLVTTGYVVKLGPKAMPTPAGAQASSTTTAEAPAQPAPTVGAMKPAGGADRVDVAGIRLGMSPDQVRAALKSKGLANYFEATLSLGASHETEAAQSGLAVRFINVIAAWSPGSDGGESYEVMFTPVPGKERVVAIVHSRSYSNASGVSASALQSGLIAKYGGYRSVSDLTESPTWRLQSSGSMETGDSCGRRRLFGGLAEFDVSRVPDNVALKTAPDEFRIEIEQCGIAIVTEDQLDRGPAQARNVTQFTVSAYSPLIGLEGQTAAAQVLQAVAGRAASRSKESSTPDL
jgi:hypothetical protein